MTALCRNLYPMGRRSIAALRDQIPCARLSLGLCVSLVVLVHRRRLQGTRLRSRGVKRVVHGRACELVFRVWKSAPTSLPLTDGVPTKYVLEWTEVLEGTSGKIWKRGF